MDNLENYIIRIERDDKNIDCVARLLDTSIEKYQKFLDVLIDLIHYYNTEHIEDCSDYVNYCPKIDLGNNDTEYHEVRKIMEFKKLEDTVKENLTMVVCEFIDNQPVELIRDNCKRAELYKYGSILKLAIRRAIEPHYARVEWNKEMAKAEIYLNLNERVTKQKMDQGKKYITKIEREDKNSYPIADLLGVSPQEYLTYLDYLTDHISLYNQEQIEEHHELENFYRLKELSVYHKIRSLVRNRSLEEAVKEDLQVITYELSEKSGKYQEIERANCKKANCGHLQKTGELARLFRRAIKGALTGRLHIQIEKQERKNKIII